VYHRPQVWLSSRKRSKVRTIFVLTLIVCLLLFAIYLKVWPPVFSPSNGGSLSQVKFWMNPNQALDAKVKLAPIGFILLFLGGFCARQMEGPVESVLSFRPVPLNLLDRLPNRFRPPPHP
jgi:hypothetical protein